MRRQRNYTPDDLYIREVIALILVCVVVVGIIAGLLALLHVFFVG